MNIKNKNKNLYSIQTLTMNSIIDSLYDLFNISICNDSILTEIDNSIWRIVNDSVKRNQFELTYEY